MIRHDKGIIYENLLPSSIVATSKVIELSYYLIV